MSIYRNNTVQPDNMPDREAIPQSYTVSASTHEGKVRPVNEDNFSINGIIGLTEGSRRSLCGPGMGEPLLCAVFDGTGGEVAGVAASRLAAEYATWLYTNLKQSPFDRERLVNHFVSECNAYIIEKLYSMNGRRGAATFVMAIISSGKLYAYSLGDSRLYLYTGGRMYQITDDHTVAMENFREGIITREQAQHSPDRHKLTAFLGIEPASAANPQKYEPVNLAKGDRLLLCTDGLYSMLSDDEISGVIASEEEDPACKLINMAVARGGKDNITCTVIECG